MAKLVITGECFLGLNEDISNQRRNSSTSLMIQNQNSSSFDFENILSDVPQTSQFIMVLSG